MTVRETTNSAALQAKSAASFKWSALGELISRSLQPVLVLIVGALITPAEFGLLGIATIALGVAQILQDMGLGKTLIQAQGEVTEQANIVFWINLLFSALLYGLILVGAPLIAGFFEAPASAPVLRVLCLRIVLLALGAVPLALLQRELRFRCAFWARFGGALATGAVIVPLAYRGLGVWALVWGMLAGSLVQTVTLWWVSSWRPALGLNWTLLPALFGFSQWILLESLLAAAINWGDSVMVGRFLGTDGLGKYRMAANALNFLTGLVFAPLTPVALSWLSRLRQQPEQFRRTLLDLSQGAAALALPLGGCIVLLAPEAVARFLGSKWAGTEVALLALGGKLAFDWFVGFNSSAFTAFGRPEINAKLLVAVCALSLPLFAWSATFGLTAFCLTRWLASLGDNALSLWASLRVFHMGLREWTGRFGPLIGAAVAAFVLVASLQVLLPAGIIRLGLQLTGGMTAYLTVVFLWAPEIVTRLLQFKRVK